MAIASADGARPPAGAVPDALSFDIEDWFHIVEVEAVSDPATWDAFPSLVERETRWILETLDAAGVRATFFVLGWVAERYPTLVADIAEAGHELGTHSYWHRKVYELTPEELRADLQRSIDVIAEAGGRPVRGFRAPSFSILPGCEWAFDVLTDLGLTYDASLFPARRGHGGYPSPPGPHRLREPRGGRPGLWELPMSIARLGPLRVPFSGGGYMRALPEWIVRLGFRSLHARGLPTVVYLHPRDFATDCPRVPMPATRRFKCYTGLATTRDKLRMLLDRYTFDTCENVLAAWKASVGEESRGGASAPS